VRRINPIHLLIALNILLIVFRDVLLSDEASAAFAQTIESLLLSLGIFGYFGIVAAHVACAFFFVPLLIPLNILGGALYGAFEGTIVAMAGITLGTIASTLSARHVFTGMHRSIDKRPRLQRLLGRADQRPNMTIALTRFMVVVPYLFQNIALAATNLSVARLTAVTAVSAIPGAAIYSLLGAGLVRAQQVNEMLLYLAVPIVLLLAISGALVFFQNRS
jgi:uncharacterized membrane protein YdjX (TVP38/TMEM64 family)